MHFADLSGELVFDLDCLHGFVFLVGGWRKKLEAGGGVAKDAGEVGDCGATFVDGLAVSVEPEALAEDVELVVAALSLFGKNEGGAGFRLLDECENFGF